MPAIIMDDLNGDYAFHVVSDALWKQITALSPGDMPGEDDHKRNEAWSEAVGWLTDTSQEKTGRPPFVPEPAGRVLATYYSQAGVIEHADFEGTIVGFLSIRR